MCKHKSGGMSKPSGAAAVQATMSDRGASTYPSQSSSSEPSAVPASASQNNSIHNQMPSGALFAAQDKSSPLAVMPSASGNCHLPKETHIRQSNFIPPNSTIMNPVFQNTSVKMSEASITSEDLKLDDSEDEDVITELSPMLLSHTFPDSYPQPHFWRTGCANGNDYVGVPTIHQDVGSLRDSGHFQSEGPYVLPYVNRCLEYNAFRPPTSEDKIETQGVYHSMSNRNWLFTPREHLASGRELSCSESPLLCIYSTNGKEGDGCPSPVDSNSYMTDTYSSSTMNTDPLPGPSGLQRHNSVHWEIGLVDSDKEEEFRMRSYSLTPTVNFAVFESESASETEDNADVFLPTPNELHTKEDQKLKVPEEDLFQIPVTSFGKVFPISPSAAQLSLASSYGDSGASICKICHMTAKENDPLISPCRCSGTMQYIHCGCLMRWLEISSKRSRKPASCELCQYQYHWHKKFKVRHWQFPHCSRKDKILHLLFFISMLVMVACAAVTILCFKQDKGTKVNPDRTELTQSEIITLVCGVAFFLAFFVAMYVEVKSHSTIYKLLVKFVYLNQQWYIDEYEKKESAPVAV